MAIQVCLLIVTQLTATHHSVSDSIFAFHRILPTRSVTVTFNLCYGDTLSYSQALNVLIWARPATAGPPPLPRVSNFKANMRHISIPDGRLTYGKVLWKISACCLASKRQKDWDCVRFDMFSQVWAQYAWYARQNLDTKVVTRMLRFCVAKYSKESELFRTKIFR